MWRTFSAFNTFHTFNRILLPGKNVWHQKWRKRCSNCFFLPIYCMLLYGLQEVYVLLMWHTCCTFLSCVAYVREMYGSLLKINLCFPPFLAVRYVQSPCVADDYRAPCTFMYDSSSSTFRTFHLRIGVRLHHVLS